MSYRMSKVFRHVLSLAILSTSIAAGQDSREHEEQINVPNDALGYVYADMQELQKTQQFSLFQRLLSNVRNEASTLSLRETGLDLTTIRNVTVIVPPARIAMSETGPAVCAAIQFNQPVRKTQVARKLATFLKSTEANGKSYFCGERRCVQLYSHETILVGDAAAVQWFAENESQGELTRLLASTRASKNHIGAAIDIRQVPPMFVSQLTSAIGYDVSGTNFLESTLDLGKKFEAYMYVHCANKLDAQGHAQRMKASIRDQITMMVATDDELQTGLKSESVGEAVTALGGLAAIRESIRVMESAQVRQDEEVAMAFVEADSDVTTILVMLSAVAAIGSSSEAKFEEISKQLEESDSVPVPVQQVQPIREVPIRSGRRLRPVRKKRR